MPQHFGVNVKFRSGTVCFKSCRLFGGSGAKQHHFSPIIRGNGEIVPEIEIGSPLESFQGSQNRPAAGQPQQPVWLALLINLSSAGIWTMVMFFMRSITKSEPQENVQGDVYASLWSMLSTILLWQNWIIMMLYTYMVVCGSRNISAFRRDLNSELNVFEGSLAKMDEKLHGPGGLWVDMMCLRVGLLWIGLGAVAFFVLAYTVGGDIGYSLGLLVAYGIGFLWLLPRAASHHSDNDPDAKRLTVLVARAILIGVPLAVFSDTVLPKLAGSLSANALIFWWPLILSVLEFFVISKLFSNQAVVGHGVEALSIEARQCVALFEGTRLGLVVLVANTVGTMQGLMASVMLSALLEGATRNNLFTLSYRLLLRRLGLSFAATATASTASHHHSLTHMGRFKRVWLGCKQSTEYWGILTLIILREINFAGALGRDDVTSDVVPGLRCGWDVIAVVAAGELAGDVITLVIHRLAVAWVPSLVVNTPAIYPATGRGSTVIQVQMWLAIGLLYSSGISSAGGLMYLFEDSEEERS